jgi:hypothetical protein
MKVPPTLLEHLERAYDQNLDHASRSIALGICLRRLARKRREVDDAAKDDAKVAMNRAADAWQSKSGIA